MSRSFSRSLHTAVSSLALVVALGASSAFAQDSAVLPEITVNVANNGQAVGGRPVDKTTAGPVVGYQALTSISASKTQTPIEQLPQSVQVIPRKVLEDQGVISQSEALLNVSGVQPLNTMVFGQLTPKVRGFPGDRVVDGLPNYYDAGARDLLVNVERLEVLKGPQGVLYAGGTNATGGIINIVSKLPTAVRSAEFGITAGGHRMWSPYFDINQPLNTDGTVLFRITGQYESTGAYTDVVRRGSYTINPTLTFTNNQGTSLTIQGLLAHREQKEYSGLPTVGTLDRSGASIRRDLFPSDPNIPKTKSDIASLTAKFDHTFNSIWSTSTTLRIANSDFKEPSQGLFSNTPSALPATFNVFNVSIYEKTKEISANTNLLAKFNWGITKNKVLFALDYNRVQENGGMWGDFVGTPVNFLNPTFPAYVDQPGAYLLAKNHYTTMGATAQWQSTIADRLHLLAGARLAHVKVSDFDGTGFRAFLTGDNLALTEKTKILPRVGAVFDVVKGVSLFAGYSEGIKPVPFFLGSSPMVPEETKQLEAGVKLNLANGLSATFAAFELTRRNTVVADPNSFFGGSLQTGEAKSRGFEADVIWQPTKNWSILASYAHIDAKVTKSTVASIVGAPLVGTPKDSGRVWANYTFTEGAAKGLSLGAGFYAASEQVAEIGKVWRTPAYATVDAKIAYEYQNWKFSLVGKNLLNRQYFVPYQYFDARVAPGDSRTVYATVSSKF